MKGIPACSAAVGMAAERMLHNERRFSVLPCRGEPICHERGSHIERGAWGRGGDRWEGGGFGDEGERESSQS